MITYKPIGAHTTNTSLDSKQSVTLPAGADGLLVQALTQNVRYTFDGTDPTTTTGFQLKASDPPVLIPLRTGAVVEFLEETAGASIEYQAVNVKGAL